MMLLHRPVVAAIFVLGLVLMPAVAPGQEEPAEAAPAGDDADQQQPTRFPGITRIDREQQIVELDAKVVLRRGEWLELIACTPNTREHESILTVPARPSHVHLALLLVGLEPGSPMTWRWEDEQVFSTPAHGPRIAVTALYEQDGRTVETPINEWVVHQETGEPLPGNVFLFTGSEFREVEEDKTVYLADLNGSVISLVNFGDDLLVQATDRTNQNDEGMWGTNTDRIPPIGTEVTVRLKALPEPPGEADLPEEIDVEVEREIEVDAESE